MPLTPPLPDFELSPDDELDLYPPVRRTIPATEGKPLNAIGPTSAFDMADYLERLEQRIDSLKHRKKPGRKPKMREGV